MGIIAVHRMFLMSLSETQSWPLAHLQWTLTDWHDLPLAFVNCSSASDNSQPYSWLQSFWQPFLKCSFPVLVPWLFSHTMHCFLQIHKLPPLSFHQYLPTFISMDEESSLSLHTLKSKMKLHSTQPNPEGPHMFHLVSLSETMQLFFDCTSFFLLPNSFDSLAH